jgi:hypothetical protein
VAKIRLHWRVGEEAGSTEGSQAWPCGYNNGVTGFDLPEGTADLWVTPECGSGEALPGTYIAPASVQRHVTRGDTVSLGAVELVVSASSCRYASMQVPVSCPPPSDAGVPPGACICDCPVTLR